MNDWQSIERAHLDIVSLSATGGSAGDIAQVQIRLSSVPPFEWVESFRTPTGVTVPADVHPILSRDFVTFSVAESGLEDYVKVLDSIIDNANQRYRSNVLPRLERQEAEQQARVKSALDREAESEQKLDALRERAKNL